MGFVGIIANPASGKDIRRVVSHATVVNNHEKVSIVRRVLLALHAYGVRRVEIMPDHFGIGVRALEGLRDKVARQHDFHVRGHRMFIMGICTACRRRDPRPE